MQLWLVRHAAAFSKSEAGVSTDAERPLTPAGSQAAIGVARAMKRHGFVPDRTLASPLLRARQTAIILLAELALSLAPELLDALTPHADPQETVAAFERLQLSGTALVVGHLPHLALLASCLVFRQPVEGIVLEPAGVCVIDLPEFPRSAQGVLRALWNPAPFAV
ncbi:MAG: phosphohistidine phosphatase SixA [Candidatus Omnitrophica bacterium]|nr:phosphohistidine phosphatase SixA [Candidatus Omnitrophota bacterium]